MIEAIARQAVKRGYILGSGIMSSKKVGINHKEYGVTSRGVMMSAFIGMRRVLGINMHTAPFTVKITGGPNGDVAGNCMRLLLHDHARALKEYSPPASWGRLYPVVCRRVLTRRREPPASARRAPAPAVMETRPDQQQKEAS